VLREVNLKVEFRFDCAVDVMMMIERKKDREKLNGGFSEVLDMKSYLYPVCGGIWCGICRMMYHL